MKRLVLVILTMLMVFGLLTGCGAKAFNNYSDFFNSFDDVSETADNKDYKANISEMMGNNEIKSEDIGKYMKEMTYKNLMVSGTKWDVASFVSGGEASTIWMNVDYDKVESVKDNYEAIKKILEDEFGSAEESINEADNVISSWSFSGSYIELLKSEKEDSLGLRLFYST